MKHHPFSEALATVVTVILPSGLFILTFIGFVLLFIDLFIKKDTYIQIIDI